MNAMTSVTGEATALPATIVNGSLRQLGDDAATAAESTTGAKAVELAEMAAMEFKPWQHEPNEWRPPSNEEWARLAKSYLVSVRVAWFSMFRTKDELVAAVDGLGEESYTDVVQRLAEAQDFFQAMLDVLKAAEARYLIAASVCALRDENAA